MPYLNSFDKSNDEQILKYFQTEQTERLNLPKPDGCEIFSKCLDELKLVTQRYSKKQIKWIRNRLLASKDRQVPPLYSLDTTDPSKWSDEVYSKAENIVESYMDNKVPDFEPMERLVSKREGFNEGISKVCDVCNRVFVGEFQWQLHMKSNKHKRALKRKNRIDV